MALTWLIITFLLLIITLTTSVSYTHLTTYLDPSGSQIGKKESIADTARVLGRMYEGIEYRGFGQAIVEELAANAGVPVWNGLTNEFHPTQMLADLLTIREHLGRIKGDVYKRQGGRSQRKLPGLCFPVYRGPGGRGGSGRNAPGAGL